MSKLAHSDDMGMLLIEAKNLGAECVKIHHAQLADKAI